MRTKYEGNDLPQSGTYHTLVLYLVLVPVKDNAKELLKTGGASHAFVLIATVRIAVKVSTNSNSRRRHQIQSYQ